MRQALALLMGLLAVQSIGNAAGDFKNGQPCMDGLCIGDGLDEVARRKWDPATTHVAFEPKQSIASLKVQERRKAEVQRIYRGDLGKAMPYLAGLGFDETGVPALRGLIVCESRDAIMGTFTGKDGNPTKVGLKLLPDPKDRQKQRWTVTNFERHHVNATTDQQQDALRAQMNARYAAVAGSKAQIGTGMYHVAGDRVSLSLRVAREDYAALKRHPLCAAAPGAAR